MKQEQNELKHEQQLQNEEIQKTYSPFRDTLKQLSKNRFALVGLFIIIFFILLGIFAPLLTSYGYEEQVLTDRLLPQSAEHWFGTDVVSRDIFYHIVYVARYSLHL